MVPNFNPRTPCGVRLHNHKDFELISNNFNPRTPCGVRRPGRHPRPSTRKISIHAPRVGCDDASGMSITQPLQFQSTHPVWGATPPPCHRLRTSSRFQSTHPVWGATWAPLPTRYPRYISIHAPRVGCDLIVRPSEFSHLISIHAPRVGCDSSLFSPSSSGIGFQSTHPVWGATSIFFIRHADNQEFQSTHPVWGATPHGPGAAPPGPISIHAPRVGCDGFSPGVSWRRKEFQSTHPVWGATLHHGQLKGECVYFNPRTPCGVRPRSCPTASILSLNFNPRTPCGVRPRRIMCTEVWKWAFQSTHPVWGATAWSEKAVRSLQFQSTHPVWGATNTYPPTPWRSTISIHAPRVGCDSQVNANEAQEMQFQSTHPVWGATLHTYIVKIINEQFQSTHPVWGATQYEFVQSLIMPDFNPRTPCGVRPDSRGNTTTATVFQSTHPVWGAT